MQGNSAKIFKFVKDAGEPCKIILNLLRMQGNPAKIFQFVKDAGEPFKNYSIFHLFNI